MCSGIRNYSGDRRICRARPDGLKYIPRSGCRFNEMNQTSGIPLIPLPPSLPPSSPLPSLLFASMATNSEDEAEAEDEGDLRLLQRADGGRAVDVHGRPLHCSVADSTARRKEVSSDIHARPQFTRGLALYAAGAGRDGGREGGRATWWKARE